MNPRILETALKCHNPYGNFDLDKFALLIAEKCAILCEQVASDANAMANSEFVTDAGRMLHEGVWGGAKNCGAQIREHFGV